MYHWLPPVLKALRAACSQVDLQIVGGVGRDPVDLLVEGTIDVGLVGHEVEDGRVLVRPLFDSDWRHHRAGEGRVGHCYDCALGG